MRSISWWKNILKHVCSGIIGELFCKSTNKLLCVWLQRDTHLDHDGHSSTCSKTHKASKPHWDHRPSHFLLQRTWELVTSFKDILFLTSVGWQILPQNLCLCLPGLISTYLQSESILEGTFYIRDNSSVTVMLSSKFGLSWNFLNYAVRYQCRSSRRLLWLAQWIYKNKTKQKFPPHVTFTEYMQNCVLPWSYSQLIYKIVLAAETAVHDYLHSALIHLFLCFLLGFNLFSFLRGFSVFWVSTESTPRTCSEQHNCPFKVEFSTVPSWCSLQKEFGQKWQKETEGLPQTSQWCQGHSHFPAIKSKECVSREQNVSSPFKEVLCFSSWTMHDFPDKTRWYSNYCGSSQKPESYVILLKLNWQQ